MNQIIFSNNASTTLASPITSSSASLSVTAGGGSLFPAITAGEQFIFTLQHISGTTVTAYEICVCTARSGDNFTSILRAQEETSALSWEAGDTVTLLPTAGGMNSFIQTTQLQAQKTNFAIDTGVVNAYAVGLTPPLTAHVVGMPIVWIPSSTNTGASTFNDGVGSGPLVDQYSNNITAGMVVIGGTYTCVWNGVYFHLLNPTITALSQMTGQISGSQMSAGAISTTLANAALTGDPTAPTAPSGSSSTQVATTAFVNPGQSTGTTGYYKLPGGVIIQWGYATTGASGSGPVDIVVSFPISFSVECVAVMVSTNRNVSGSGEATSGSNFSSNYTTTNCTITVDNIPGGIAGGHWLAIGF